MIDQGWGKISDSIDENGSNHCMFWKKNLSKSTIFGMLEQYIIRLIHSLILKHLQILI